MASERNTVSVWFWILAIIITALPCIGTLVALVLAFTGDNASRKNYFKAVLLLQLLGVILIILIQVLGLGAVLFKTLQENGWKLPQGA